jgi:hypothetical protein
MTVLAFYDTERVSRNVTTINNTACMSTRNLPGCKGRPGRKGDNLTDICEPIV